MAALRIKENMTTIKSTLRKIVMGETAKHFNSPVVKVYKTDGTVCYQTEDGRPCDKNGEAINDSHNFSR
jgi:hypothetical protein